MITTFTLRVKSAAVDAPLGRSQNIVRRLTKDPGVADESICVAVPERLGAFPISTTNAVFKALSDPTRREVLRLLAHGERTAGELAESFDMTKPSMSHHFAVLKAAELIRSRREGQQIYYSLDTTVLQDVLARMFDLFGTKPAPDGQEPRR